MALHTKAIRISSPFNGNYLIHTTFLCGSFILIFGQVAGPKGQLLQKNASEKVDRENIPS